MQDLEYYNYSAPKGGDEVGDKEVFVWYFLEVVPTTTYQPRVFIHGYILGFEFSEWAMFWREKLRSPEETDVN
jgi:hypothetical protein